MPFRNPSAALAKKYVEIGPPLLRKGCEVFLYFLFIFYFHFVPMRPVWLFRVTIGIAVHYYTY